jgi:trimethylamine---corrinoid protein Co-methyltransferase
MVIHQMKNPEVPFVFGTDATLMDMPTAIYAYGAPELQIMNITFANLAPHYHLPFFCIAGATDSKVLDAQAGAEMAISLLVSALSGCNLIHDPGIWKAACAARSKAWSWRTRLSAWSNAIAAGLTSTPKLWPWTRLIRRSAKGLLEPPAHGGAFQERCLVPGGV